MPKIIPPREIEPREILELERLAKNGTAFEARRARFILALSNPLGLRPNQIGAAHGFSVSTSSTLRNRFNALGPEGCRYQFNELASLGRCKLSFEAQERAVAIVKAEALSERPYRGAVPVEKTLAIMADTVGTAIDANCFEHLKKIIKSSPEFFT